LGGFMAAMVCACSAAGIGELAAGGGGGGGGASSGVPQAKVAITPAIARKVIVAEKKVFCLVMFILL
jgi:hypothetical protein